MQNLSLEQKHQQFDEFFMIKHTIPVNMRLLEDDFLLPDVEDLHQHMPYEFQIASELSSIDTKALRPLRRLGEHAVELAEFLNHQSRKIDLMMSLILQQHAKHEQSSLSLKFGGGGIVIDSEDPLEVGVAIELKLFLREEASAIFCFAEVITCKPVDDKYHVSLIFTRIREVDQDLLVKASLHIQAANLRKRKTQEKL
ncbi:PilZ domain-containing protein [Paraglaciecola arctica]|uniref:PilZ domain-containing protein n=1 Tax=Paraglaciecola arctica TaxID=1128911 RepID=UPI001C07BAB5|nr:PilZ domain-containing protein [Paraglaciecola arctica]MBU3001787.1 PilZ domain-containing protein [Paraglaciecola arctica]